MKLYVAVCAFLLIPNSYDVCVDALGFPSFLLQGSYKGNSLPRQITNGVLASLGQWLLYATMSEFSFLIADSIAALRFMKAITKKLVVSDTDGALALLFSEQEQSDGILGPEFVAALTKMIENLALLWSHIPNYLIYQVKSEQDHETEDPDLFAPLFHGSDGSDCNEDAFDDLV